MARGRKTSLTITLTPEERQTLLAWQRSTTIRLGLLRRARIILLVADGIAITDIAARVGINRRFVYKWVQRFLEQGVEGLADKPGRGAPGPTHTVPGSPAGVGPGLTLQGALAGAVFLHTQHQHTRIGECTKKEPECSTWGRVIAKER